MKKFAKYSFAQFWNIAVTGAGVLLAVSGVVDSFGTVKKYYGEDNSK